jgi:hypothetical protein
MGYYLPRKDADLVTWSGNFKSRVFDNLVRYGVTEAEYTALSTAVANFASAVVKAYGPDGSPAEVVKKNAYRKILEERIRALVNFKFQSPAITDEDRTDLGINKRNEGGKGAPTPIAKKAPGVTVDTSVLAHVGVHFYNADSLTKRGKPEGQHCVEIVSKVGPPKPQRWDEFTHSNVDTRTPYVFSFEYDQRGQILFFSVRWENTRGQKGPWSEIHAVVIP